MPALLHLLREHIAKEENGLFPAAAIHLSDEQWERLDASEPAHEESLA